MFALRQEPHHRVVAIPSATDFRNLYHDASVGLSLFVGVVYVLRRLDLVRPFRVPGYLVVPAVFAAVAVFMAVFAFVQ